MKLTCKHCSEEFEIEDNRIDTYYDFELDINTDNPNWRYNAEMTSAIMNTYRGLFERIGFKVNSVKNLEISKGLYCPNCEYFYTNNELIKILSERCIFLLDEFISKLDLKQRIRKAATEYFEEKQNEIA